MKEYLQKERERKEACQWMSWWNLALSQENYNMDMEIRKWIYIIIITERYSFYTIIFTFSVQSECWIQSTLRQVLYNIFLISKSWYKLAIWILIYYKIFISVFLFLNTILVQDLNTTFMSTFCDKMLHSLVFSLVFIFNKVQCHKLCSEEEMKWKFF